jgi:regulator of sirC expression with transglutaminase-like and TPR domain
VDELRQLLLGDSEAAPLDLAALQLAAIEYPGLAVEPFLALLDSYAREAGERVSDDTPGQQFIRIVNEYLFDELGFVGNVANYYNPANSCLNNVLTDRTGIPITLSVVYMEISRRLDSTVFGIGLPGHFLVQYYDDEFTALVDPFHAGRILCEQECFELARQVTGIDVSRNPDVLRPVSKRHIVLRMLNNLRAAYFRAQNPAKAIAVLNLLIEAMPESAEEYKQRGICLAQLQDFKRARRDLEMYLLLSPDASDREQVMAHVARLREKPSALH